MKADLCLQISAIKTFAQSSVEELVLARPQRLAHLGATLHILRRQPLEQSATAGPGLSLQPGPSAGQHGRCDQRAINFRGRPPMKKAQAARAEARDAGTEELKHDIYTAKRIFRMAPLWPATWCIKSKSTV